jgi:hypothetical protein
MLTSLLGIRLIVLTGQNIPLPASYDIMSALTRVEVTNDAQSGDGFQMTFSLGKGALDYSLVQSGALDPFTRVIIGVLLGASPEVLIDGVITHQQVAPSPEPGMSTLTVTGKDVSVMLDLEEKNHPFKNQTDSEIVRSLLWNYPQLGLVQDVAQTLNVSSELQRIPRQHETDLKCIQRLARKNGFVFYIEPLTFGMNTAYWGPTIRGGVPQPALTMNMGDRTNVKSLSFSQDALAPVTTKGTFVDPIFKISLPIPQLPSLRIPPFVPSPTPAKRVVLQRKTANENPAQAATSAVATLTNAPDSVTADGEVDAVRYGSVLRARKLVGVRGVGFSYDGLYYVRSVTHSIQRGEYTQRFSISREGTGSLLPVLPS